MGKRGPPKLPTQLKVLRGTGSFEPGEVRPEIVKGLQPPGWLTEDSKKIWFELSERLEKLGLLTSIDQNAFGRYCDIIPKWLRAKQKIDQDGFYYPIYHKQTRVQVKKGIPPQIKFLMQFPEVAIYSTLSKELSRLENLFGMNPSARASLRINETPKNSALEEMLFGS
jgi:P27 family predicted phage terminase small subunit